MALVLSLSMLRRGRESALRQAQEPFMGDGIWARRNQTKKETRITPRVKFLGWPVSSVRDHNSTLAVDYRTRIAKRKARALTKLKPNHVSWDGYETMFRPLKLNQSMCEPLGDWQMTFHPTCQTFHEIDMTHANIQHLARGGWRSTFRFLENGNTPVALKVLRTKYYFEPFIYRRHIIDAVVSDRLSGSGIATDIYGYCGQSVINEYADMNLKTAVNGWLKKEQSFHGTLRRRLEIGRDVTEAVAVLHERGVTVHHDLKLNNFVVQTTFGNLHSANTTAIKINDFNDAELIWRNTTDGGECQFRRRYWRDGFKAPEQRLENGLTSAIDVFALGGILYFLLTGVKPFEGGGQFSSVFQGSMGKLPESPLEVLYVSDNPTIDEVWNLIIDCWADDPNDRPSAREVVKTLHSILEKT